MVRILALVHQDGPVQHVEVVGYQNRSFELDWARSFILVVCTSPCLNSGTCTGPNTCTCVVSSWSGATCATRKLSLPSFRV